MAVYLISMVEHPDNALAKAALHYDLGCEVQATSLFQSALNKVQTN